MNASKLIKVTYFDPKSDIRLLCYADTVVWDTKPAPTLIALRFGGYPERVQGLADAIYGGATMRRPVLCAEKPYGMAAVKILSAYIIGILMNRRNIPTRRTALDDETVPSPSCPCQWAGDPGADGQRRRSEKRGQAGTRTPLDPTAKRYLLHL